MKSMLILMLLLLTQSASAVERATMKGGPFSGTLHIREEVTILSVEAWAQFSFCWGICGSANSGTKLPLVTEIDLKKSDSIRFAVKKNFSASGYGILGKFSFCEVEIKVTGRDKDGNFFNERAQLSYSADKAKCKADMTPESPAEFELVSYDDDRGRRSFFFERL